MEYSKEDLMEAKKQRDRFISVGIIWENATLHGDPHPFATFFRESDE